MVAQARVAMGEKKGRGYKVVFTRLGEGLDIG